MAELYIRQITYNTYVIWNANSNIFSWRTVCVTKFLWLHTPIRLATLSTPQILSQCIKKTLFTANALSKSICAVSILNTMSSYRPLLIYFSPVNFHHGYQTHTYADSWGTLLARLILCLPLKLYIRSYVQSRNMYQLCTKLCELFAKQYFLSFRIILMDRVRFP